MKVGIYFNKNYLTENQSSIEIIRSAFNQKGVESTIIDTVADLDGLDVLVVLGGDGTILTVATECAKRKIKIIGINYGHLGFLTECEPDPEQIESIVAIVCKGSYQVKKLMLLDIAYENKHFLALNDFVVQRSTGGHNFSNTIAVKAEIDGSTVDNYIADGIIVSTPTGSTAYSLSAGGSILTPNLDAFILTPICAHSLHSRPVVFNANSRLIIKPKKGNTPLNIIVDGKIVDVIGKPTNISIVKSDCFAEFITCKPDDFFNKLLIKLNIWSK